MRKKQKNSSAIEVTRLSIAVPTKLKQAFKKATVLNDNSMNEVVVSFIERYVNEYPIPEIRPKRLRKPSNRRKAGVMNG